MKSRIINGLTSLMNAEGLEEKVNLKIKVSHLIQLADLNLEGEKEVQAKSRIVSSLSGYIEASQEENEAYRQLIASHIAFLELQLAG